MSQTPPGVVERLLADRIGLDPSSVGPTLIARGVVDRMTALGIASKADYERALLGSAEELQALVEEVVVPESWFFRDARPFEVLADFARSGWLSSPARPPLTALSLPCAGGEEPYSIALTLLEAGLGAGRFRVDAADVSARSLVRAIAGVYGPNAFRGVPPARRSAWFRDQGGAFAIDPEARSTVRFRLGNLLDPTLFDDRPPFDVVFCRNLLIYLDDDAHRRGFATLGRLVADGGLLFLGHADRPDDPADSPFSATGDDGSFAYRKGPVAPSKPRRAAKAPASPRTKAAKPRPASGPLASPLPPGEGPGVRVAAPPMAPEGGPVGRRQAGAPPHPGPLPKGEGGRPPEELAGSPASTLDRASGLADLGRYDEAARLVDRAFAEGGASARGFFLLGLIRQAEGDRDRAEAHFLKAIYLDAQHDEALLSLASIARRKGDVAAESAYRRRAERVLSRKGAS